MKLSTVFPDPTLLLPDKDSFVISQIIARAATKSDFYPKQHCWNFFIRNFFTNEIENTLCRTCAVLVNICSTQMIKKIMLVARENFLKRPIVLEQINPRWKFTINDRFSHKISFENMNKRNKANKKFNHSC